MRYTQPQTGPLRIAPRWARRQIAAAVPRASGVIATDGGFYIPSGANLQTAVGPRGVAVTSSGVSYAAVRLSGNTLNTVWDAPSYGVTAFALIRRFGNNLNGNAPIFGNISPTIAPYSAYSFIDLNGAGDLAVDCSAGGTYRHLDCGANSLTGAVQFVALIYDGATFTAWIDGVQRASMSASGSITYTNSSDRGTAIGNFYNYTASARSFNGEIYLCGVSPYALSSAEIIDLSRNPWQLFQTRSHIFKGSAAALYPTLANLRFQPATSTGGTVAVDLS